MFDQTFCSHRPPLLLVDIKESIYIYVNKSIYHTYVMARQCRNLRRQSTVNSAIAGDWDGLTLRRMLQNGARKKLTEDFRHRLKVKVVRFSEIEKERSQRKLGHMCLSHEVVACWALDLIRITSETV